MPANQTPMCISLSHGNLNLMENFSRRAFPREACGLLLGLPAPNAPRVLEISLGKNLATAQEETRFDLDPLHLVQMEDHARAKGWQILGLWHSHPKRAAIPSRADQQAALVGWSYPILALDAEGRLNLRSWRWCGTRFQEQRVCS